MVNRLNSPMGSNILAEIFSNNRFVVGSFFACLWRSTKSKTNWSVAVFQSEPNTFTIAFSEAWSAASKGLLVVFAYDSSSSVTIFLTVVTTAGFTQSSARLIASCTIFGIRFPVSQVESSLLHNWFGLHVQIQIHCLHFVFSTSNKIVNLQVILQDFNEFQFEYFGHQCV